MNKKKPSLTALVLTYNEEMHLRRCLESLKDICEEIVIIDSFSKDETENIAKEFGASFYQNPFVNHAVQLNWGLENAEINTDWVIRVDADEYISKELASSIKSELPNLKNTITGIRVKRLMYFFNKPLKKAGMYPIWHLKLWRTGKAMCEQRWMDERMKLSTGETTTL